MLRRNIIWLPLFLLFLIETTLLHWIIPLSWHEHIQISPHFVFILILFVAIYSNHYFALVLGLVFGLLQDVLFYGYMIGPYSFAIGIIAYLTGMIFRRINVSFISTIFIIIIADLLFHLTIYGLYRLFRVIDVTLDGVFMYNILPSILFNLLFAFVIYIPARYLMEYIEEHREEKEN